MEQAYLKASSNGQYPAHARQIMYAARPQILAKADCDRLDDAYFTQQLLPDYIQEHPGLTAKWDVVFDARGHLYEPHTNREIALGTIDVRAYLNKIRSHVVDEIAADVGVGGLFPTMGPQNRYGAILFIEKEGFLPLFRKIRLFERYDMAPMSTKGMSTAASRLLVDTLCWQDVPLLVVHDFDKAGFSILSTLQQDTRRYRFSHNVNVIDLGLRLEDVQEWNLQSEQCTFGKSNPRGNLRENGATEEEIEFLCAGYGSRGYHGKRVELNAFASDELVHWIEGKLQQQAIKKVIPDRETLETAYRRARLTNVLNEQLASLVEAAKNEVDALKLDSGRIAREVKKRLQQHREMSWDQAITEIIEAKQSGEAA